MRAVAFCLLALVAAASARDFPLAQSRSLLQVTDLNCQAKTTATLVLDGSGSGSARSEAFCEALADAEKVIERVVEDYVKPFTNTSSGDQCTVKESEDAVQGVAKAIASVYADASTKVEITGTGKACADAFAAGDSLAVSLVKVFLKVSLQLIEKKYPTQNYHEDVEKAIDGKRNEATGATKGTAAAAVIASAWASASAEACTTGGFEEDFEEIFVKSVATAIAELWSTIVVELCSNFEDAKTDELKEWAKQSADSLSDITGEVKVEDFVEITGGGSGSGFAGEIPTCGSGIKDACCGGTAEEQSTCGCGSGCSVTKGSGGKPGQTVWVLESDDEEEDKCVC